MRNLSKGNCYICGDVIGKRAMKRHLLEKHAEYVGSGAERCYLIRAEGAEAPNYWKYFDIALDKKLSSLDNFLRNIWLECCGHLSEFSTPADILGKGRIIAELDVGEIFYHRYDFGTTTELKLVVEGETTRPKQRGAIRLLARNIPPEHSCLKCGKKADYINAATVYDEEPAYYCKECTEMLMDDTEDGPAEFYPLLITNSPRCGECGYEGEFDRYEYTAPLADDIKAPARSKNKNA